MENPGLYAELLLGSPEHHAQSSLRHLLACSLFPADPGHRYQNALHIGIKGELGGKRNPNWLTAIIVDKLDLSAELCAVNRYIAKVQSIRISSLETQLIAALGRHIRHASVFPGAFEGQVGQRFFHWRQKVCFQVGEHTLSSTGCW